MSIVCKYHCALKDERLEAQLRFFSAEINGLSSRKYKCHWHRKCRERHQPENNWMLPWSRTAQHRSSVALLWRVTGRQCWKNKGRPLFTNPSYTINVRSCLFMKWQGKFQDEVEAEVFVFWKVTLCRRSVLPSWSRQKAPQEMWHTPQTTRLYVPENDAAAADDDDDDNNNRRKIHEGRRTGVRRNLVVRVHVFCPVARIRIAF